MRAYTWAGNIFLINASAKQTQMRRYTCRYVVALKNKNVWQYRTKKNQSEVEPTPPDASAAFPDQD